MNWRARIIAACTILAAFAAGPCAAAPNSSQASPSSEASQSSEAKTAAALTSFGAGLSANELDALSLHAPGSGQAMQLQLSSFASSLALTPTFALDGGYRIDTAQRFASYDQALDPLRDSGSFLALADGGRYAGITAIANSDIGLRLGVSNWTGRLDNTAMDGAAIGLPAIYDTSQVNSVLAGVTWNFKDWVGVGFNAISSFREGTPLGYAGVAPLSQSAATQALQISARVNLGGNWVTTAAFGEGLTQLRQRDGVPTSLDAQTFALTVAKRGVFGGDAVGFSFSRPAPGSVGGFGSLVNATGELPPVMAQAGLAPETDFQLGYVTNFLHDRLVLQTNAAFQVNPQGQSGASAVSLLSRAKIKF